MSSFIVRACSGGFPSLVPSYKANGGGVSCQMYAIYGPVWRLMQAALHMSLFHSLLVWICPMPSFPPLCFNTAAKLKKMCALFVCSLFVLLCKNTATVIKDKGDLENENVGNSTCFEHEGLQLYYKIYLCAPTITGPTWQPESGFWSNRKQQREYLTRK